MNISTTPLQFSAVARPGATPTAKAAPPAQATDTVEISATDAPEIQESSTPTTRSTSWVKTGTAVLAGLAGLAAIGAIATPAQAQTSVGVHIGSDGWGITVRDGHHHGHGHGHGGWGRHDGGWGHRGGHRFPGPGHRIPGPHIPGPHYPGYPGPHFPGHQGPFRNGWGIDGQFHRFDRSGHVNDASGHYQLRSDIFGNVYRDYRVFD